jgi:hypothetical protein
MALRWLTSSWRTALPHLRKQLSFHCWLSTQIKPLVLYLQQLSARRPASGRHPRSALDPLTDQRDKEQVPASVTTAGSSWNQYTAAKRTIAALSILTFNEGVRM